MTGRGYGELDVAMPPLPHSPATSSSSPSRQSTIAASLGYAALAATDSILAGKDTKAAKRLRMLVKPTLMPLLGKAFTGSTSGDTSLLRRGTVTAQAFSWGGDVALLGPGQKSFLGGVGSFAGAHLAYIAGLLSVRGETSQYNRTGLKAAATLWVTTAPVMAWAAGRKDPALRGPVAAYATLLAAMFASSWTLDPGLRRSGRHLLQAGTTLFLVSDSILGAQEFLLTERDPRLERAVMATYTAGQALIAGGVAVIEADRTAGG